MQERATAYQLYVGIDIAADTFTAAWRTRAGTPTGPFTAEQTPTGFAALQRRLAASGAAPTDALVVMEATGNYWVALAVTLHEVGYRVAVVNPRQAHHFAKARLRRAKTDALDARDLARLAAALRPGPWSPPPTVYPEVRQRLVARVGLLAQLHERVAGDEPLAGLVVDRGRRIPAGRLEPGRELGEIERSSASVFARRSCAFAKWCAWNGLMTLT